MKQGLGRYISTIVLYLGILAAFSYEAWRIFVANNLGAQPAETLNKSFGTYALWCFLINSYLGCWIALQKPLPTWLRPWIRQRRPLGVAMFAFTLFHVGFFVLKKGGDPGEAWAEAIGSVYLLAGLLAWTLTTVLATTSNDFSVRRLTARKWKNLHRLVYVIFVAIIFHTFLIEKANRLNFILYLAPLALLYVLRVFRWLRAQAKA